MILSNGKFAHKKHQKNALAHGMQYIFDLNLDVCILQNDVNIVTVKINLHIVVTMHVELVIKLLFALTLKKKKPTDLKRKSNDLNSCL